MAIVLKQVVNQYGTGNYSGIAVRCIIQYFDDETGLDEQVILDRDDMVNPDSQIFDNYKNMVEQHMIP